MKINNYIREQHGAVTVVATVGGYSLLVDTRRELLPDDWDQAISDCHHRGYVLISDVPDSSVGVWEIWFMYPLPPEPEAA